MLIRLFQFNRVRLHLVFVRRVRVCPSPYEVRKYIWIKLNTHCSRTFSDGAFVPEDLTIELSSDALGRKKFNSAPTLLGGRNSTYLHRHREERIDVSTSSPRQNETKTRPRISRF